MFITLLKFNLLIDDKTIHQVHMSEKVNLFEMFFSKLFLTFLSYFNRLVILAEKVDHLPEFKPLQK